MKKRLTKYQATLPPFLIFCLVVISCNSASEKTEEIPNVPLPEKTEQKITKQEAYNELLLRNRNTEKGVSVDTVPTNERLRVYRDKELYDVIHETDDRKNLYEITNPELIADAKKGACILKRIS